VGQTYISPSSLATLMATAEGPHINWEMGRGQNPKSPVGQGDSPHFRNIKVTLKTDLRGKGGTGSTKEVKGGGGGVPGGGGS